jgi:hypothetical protein
VENRKSFKEPIYYGGGSSTLLRNVGKHLQDVDRVTFHRGL